VKNIVQSSARFLAGLQNIEHAIIHKVRENGVPITGDGFRWNRGKGFVPPPESISLESKLQGKPANGVLSREQGVIGATQPAWDLRELMHSLQGVRP